MANWSDYIFGGEGKLNTLPIYNQQQQGIQNQGLQYLAQLLQALQQQGQQQGGGMQALGGLGGYSSRGGDFAPIAQQAMKQFASDTVPGLAERFTAIGGGGTSLGSSGFQGALGAAGAGLQENLAALGSQYGLQQRGLDINQQGQNQGNIINLLRTLLTPQNEYMYTPGRQGFLPAAAQGVGTAAGIYGGAKLAGLG